MKLEEKYISHSASAETPDATKTTLSDDAFAICEFIEQLKEMVDFASRRGTK